MDHSTLTAALADMTAPLTASLGLELWGIELAFGGRSIVRVFVENENGVSIEQCAELSRLLSASLDVEDCIPGAYVLEVSSPGLERTFFSAEQLARALGQKVEITLHRPQAAWPGRKKFRGLLQEVPAFLSRNEEENPPEIAGQNLLHSSAQSAPKDKPHDALFFLKADAMARPGDDEPIIAFAFADVKKATQIHCIPERTLPGKSAGKKNSRQQNANAHASE
ncbi:MAG: ribosome maturation factor RimP [Desulfovibrio sp.]|jgi:ribosome maturation factor RimP|nr:ribosome maturation factor RimP [Desulfovibrio sp.]